jgi:hypothetical protein
VLERTIKHRVERHEDGGRTGVAGGSLLAAGTAALHCNAVLPIRRGVSSTPLAGLLSSCTYVNIALQHFCCTAVSIARRLNELSVDTQRHPVTCALFVMQWATCRTRTAELEQELKDARHAHSSKEASLQQYIEQMQSHIFEFHYRKMAAVQETKVVRGSLAASSKREVVLRQNLDAAAAEVKFGRCACTHYGTLNLQQLLSCRQQGSSPEHHTMARQEHRVEHSCHANLAYAHCLATCVMFYSTTTSCTSQLPHLLRNLWKV